MPNNIWTPGSQWLNSTTILQQLQQPFTTASQWTSPLGGVTFMYGLFSLMTILYTWLHFKHPLPAGLVSVLLGITGQLIPELRMLGFIFLFLGFTAVIYEVMRRVGM
jgi:hypothetical protein